MAATTIEPAASPVAAMQEWFTRIQNELPKIFRAAWAQSIMESFESAGVKNAAEIDADALTCVAASQSMTVEGLLASVKRCPLGFSLTALLD